MTRPGSTHRPHWTRDAAGEILETTGTCSLYVDLQLEDSSPMPGDWIATPAGSRYLVDHVRKVRHRRHSQLQRYQLRCLRLPRHTDPPEDVHVIWLQWYPRGQRR